MIDQASLIILVISGGKEEDFMQSYLVKSNTHRVIDEVDA